MGLSLFEGTVLGIETSCDETSAALLSGSNVLSNVVSSQAALHERWGGVVPEAAAREHVEALVPVVSEAIGGRTPDAVAVTNRPGLIGALSVGVSGAKALADAWQVPLVGVNHLEAHVLSPFLRASPPGVWPHLCLLVSGGHTVLYKVAAPGEYLRLVRTIDDASGEAFDKGARLLGFGYPGGHALSESARQGDPKRYRLPIAMRDSPDAWSFSGLKTAALRLVETEAESLDITDAAASLQHVIVESLVQKTVAALERESVSCLTLTGGVAANWLLRERLAIECERLGCRFVPAELEFCTDNAAMVALAGSVSLAQGKRDGPDLDCASNAPL